MEDFLQGSTDGSVEFIIDTSIVKRQEQPIKQSTVKNKENLSKWS